MQHKSSIRDLIAKKIKNQSAFASVVQESLAARVAEQPVCKAIKSGIVAKRITSVTVSPKWEAPQQLVAAGFSKTPGMISKLIRN